MIRFLLLFIITVNFAFSQQRQDHPLWHLIVVDANTAKGIPGATISINKKHYLVTDLKGATQINKSLINAKDSINISCIGYNSLLVRLGTNHNVPDTVRLTASKTLLKEVKVGGQQLENISLGVVKKEYNHRVTSPNQEYLQYIPNDKNIRGTIISVEYVINDALQGIERPFKIGLYTKSENSTYPDQQLIQDSIIVYNSERKRKVSVDISKYNIQFPEDGVMVAFETLSPSYYGQDSIWYKGKKMVKVPGIDMDNKNFHVDHSKKDREDTYAMVRMVDDRWSVNDIKSMSYVYSEGNNFAIFLTVRPE